MNAMLEISRLRQPAFAQNYGESRRCLSRGTPKTDGSLRPKDLRPSGRPEARSERSEIGRQTLGH